MYWIIEFVIFEILELANNLQQNAIIKVKKTKKPSPMEHETMQTVHALIAIKHAILDKALNKILFY